MRKEIRKIKLLVLGLSILAVLIGALATWFVIYEVQKCDCNTQTISQTRYEAFIDTGDDNHGRMMVYYYDKDITSISFYVTKYDVMLGLEDK